jgi:hypothetical protein
MIKTAALTITLAMASILTLPRALRFTIFAIVSALDVLLKPRGCRRVRSDEPHAFLTREIAGVPARTFGRLKRDGSGHIVFVYRPYLIFPKRAVIIPHGRVAAETGAVLPTLLYSAPGQDRHTMLAHLLPRYRSYEKAVVAHLTVSGT